MPIVTRMTDRVTLLRGEATRFADAVERGPLDASVVACPGWDVRQLAGHLGHIHRWARYAAANGAPMPPEQAQAPPADPSELVAWVRTGASQLADTLDGLDPDGVTWHPFPVPKTAGVWPRRQLQETMIHRWDAEQAIGIRATLDAGLAADGIDEYFGVLLPRLVVREHLTLPAGSVHVHLTDVPGEWTAREEGGQVAVERGHVKGDAAIRGRAQDVLLALWRRPLPVGALDLVGDRSVAEGWLSLGGAVARAWVSGVGQRDGDLGERLDEAVEVVIADGERQGDVTARSDVVAALEQPEPQQLARRWIDMGQIVGAGDLTRDRATGDGMEVEQGTPSGGDELRAHLRHRRVDAVAQRLAPVEVLVEQRSRQVVRDHLDPGGEADHVVVERPAVAERAAAGGIEGGHQRRAIRRRRQTSSRRRGTCRAWSCPA